MRGFRSAGWVTLIASAMLTAGLASAAPVRTVKTEPLIATGSLTYTWSGDSSRGCAAVGVCGIHGELILRPQSSGQSVAPGAPLSVSLDASATVRVVREQAGVVVGECVDMPASSSFESLFFNPSARRDRTATLQPPPSSGRCSGPTSAELAAVTVPVRRSGRSSFDLTGTRSFGAGPFSGTLVSTMRLLPAPASSGFGSSSSGGSGGSGQPSTQPLFETVQLRYRISSAQSAIQTQFRGTGEPTCELLDACGTSGSIAFSIQPPRTLTITGTRLVHRRLSRRQVLSDLRRGRLMLNEFQLVTGRVTESLNWPDGSSCHDAAATPTLLLSAGSGGGPPPPGRTIPVTISGNGGGPGTDIFRTHCPGPADADLFGQNLNTGNQTYATGTITVAQLLHKQSALTLYEPATFSSFGYAGSRTGSIALDLTLIKVRVETPR